jgi:hypothetical protein
VIEKWDIFNYRRKILRLTAHETAARIVLAEGRTMPGPQRVSDKPFTVDLRHHLFPWLHNMPVLGRMQGTEDVFLPVFSSRDLLIETMIHMRIDFDGVKQIDDPGEFMASLPHIYNGVRLRVIVDPHITAKGVKFTEVVRETLN